MVTVRLIMCPLRSTATTIPRRIGIAGGESKHAAIRAAVIGGRVNVLITDTGTATALLQRERSTTVTATT
jgi:DNA-binding transcriptional regulator LsrR (DeoR family)